MALHRLAGVTIGVPNLPETAQYYSDFGLLRVDGQDGAQQAVFATANGGEQLTLVSAPRRRAEQIRLEADDPDDIARISASLDRLGTPWSSRADGEISACDRGTGVTVSVKAAARRPGSGGQAPVSYNTPGHAVRLNERAPALLRTEPVTPRKLGHVVIASLDQESSVRFFVEGLGFKVSDSVVGRAAFMRCSTDHHNVLVQATPVQFLHHTSWQVDDVDEVGRGATAMLEHDPSRHVWGLGRHHIGSNFFWYLRDPAGNFSEYYADLDCIVDEALWNPRVWEGKLGLYSWGPPPPPSFLRPDDLAALMTGAHSA